MTDATATADAVEVLQLLNRYGQALDAHDWTALQAVFAPDASADYSSIAGDDARPQGREAVVGWLSTALGTRLGTYHFMTNHVVDVDGDRARSRHYMHNRNLSLCGVYTCEHRRTVDGWRIAALRLDERVMDQRGLDEGRDVPGAPPPEGVVDRITRLTDRLDLQELGPRYGHLIDAQRWDDLPGIFTPDATADYTSIGGADARLSGLPAIRAWLEASLGDRVDAVPWHYVTDTIVTLHGDTASTRSYMHNRLLQVIGVYEADAVRTGDGWRWSRLVLDARMMPGTPPS
jgi:hypothetical protein